MTGATPDRPADEAERLEALRAYEVLDTLPEQAFDDLSQLAAHICGTPIALINLLDAERGWFKARVGLGATEVARDEAMCSWAINEPDGAFVVDDLAADARFEENPLVAGDGDLRFYAGAPLVTGEGHALGTICVLDRRPRQLSPAQVQALEALSRQVVALLEARRNLALLQVARKAEQAMVARASHELRTPMNAVLGYAQLLAGDDRLDPRLAGDVQAIITAGGDLLAQIDRLLDAGTVPKSTGAA